MPKHVHNVGTMLLEDGLLTEAQLDDAIASQEESGLPLVSVLLDGGLVEEADLMKAVARRLGIEYELRDGEALLPGHEIEARHGQRGWQ